MSLDVSFAPFRSLEDFLFSKARFQRPSFGDIEKWSNRVVANLMYYQTNYLVLTAIVFINFGIMSPKKMLLGLFVLGLLALAYYLTRNSLSQTSKNSTNKSNSKSQVQETFDYSNYKPYISVLLLICGVYLIIYQFSSVALLLLSLLVSIIIILIHASLRKRNLKNKLNNKIETVGLKRTPMGILLQLINIQSDDFLN